MTMKKDVRTRAEAKKLMWEYYSENKASLPKWVRECREQIIEGLQLGIEIHEVFDAIIEIATPVEDCGWQVRIVGTT